MASPVNVDSVEAAFVSASSSANAVEKIANSDVSIARLNLQNKSYVARDTY